MFYIFANRLDFYSYFSAFIGGLFTYVSCPHCGHSVRRPCGIRTLGSYCTCYRTSQSASVRNPAGPAAKSKDNGRGVISTACPRSLHGTSSCISRATTESHALILHISSLANQKALRHLAWLFK